MQFHEHFAGDLSEEQVALMARAQVFNAADNFKAVVTTAAWRTKPSRMLVAGKDRAINRDLERWDADRAKSQKIEAPGGSDAVYGSQPMEAAALIEKSCDNQTDKTTMK